MNNGNRCSSADEWEDYVSSNTTEENQRFSLYVGEQLDLCPLKNGESLDRIFQEWMDNRLSITKNPVGGIYSPTENQ